MRLTRRVRVTGQVQGVFFRAWTRNEARRLRVSGWVRNCEDGSVEALLEGNEQAVEQLIGLMRHGPPGARVEGLSASVAEPENLGGFEVRH
jgi:acylphosphatase